MSESVATVVPRCPHFGSCGGCVYQHVPYADQLRLKQAQVETLLKTAGLGPLPAITVHSAEPYSYRNRIRLHAKRVEGDLRFGYVGMVDIDFVPITTCPIAAPILWTTAEALLAAAESGRDTAVWLNATAQVELFVDDTLSKVQMTFLCAARTKAPQGNFTRMMSALQQRVPEVIGAEAAAFDPRTGPTGRTIDTWGAPGLNYRVPAPEGPAETYWITRGGFFQVNRFLLPKLLELVTGGRSGTLAWDLFAGVGLFSRILARSFAQVMAVEANPTAVRDLRAALVKLGKQHTAVEATTLAFLQQAITQRDHPDLIVLDPPRAGAGIEACALLNRLAAPHIVYVSCDPATLARDLRELQNGGYRIDELHLIDLFPQTSHMESVAILSR